MTIETWLSKATRQLTLAGIGTGRLDALVLLEDCLGKNRAHLLAHPGSLLSTEQVEQLDAQISRRSAHEPLAYIRGKTEFFGRVFTVNPAVLEPRPESESIIELFKKLPLHGEFRVADVGTGSGALGIAASLERPEASVDLIDIDPATLKVAKMNVVLHTIGISVIESDLLEGTPQDYDVLLCNLPYVPDSFHINEAAQREPKIAIFGGPDGLDLYRRLFGQIKKIQKKPLFILTECLPPQQELLKEVAATHGYRQDKVQDFVQLFVPNGR